MVCALLGHSHWHTSFWSYIYCARCWEQVGDNLIGFQRDGLGFEHDGCKGCAEYLARLSRWERLVVWLEAPILRRKVARE